MSIDNLKEMKDFKFKLQIKLIDNKTKEISYQNIFKEENDISNFNQLKNSNLREDYIKVIDGLDLFTLEKIKKKLDDSK